MKKTFIVLLTFFLIIVCMLYAFKIKKESEGRELKKYNLEFENYLNKTIYGADLATLINKAVNLNEENNIQKDEHNHYIENGENSLKIEVKLSYTKKTYSMEESYNNDTSEFVKYFNSNIFKCNQIFYHKNTGKVSKMMFEQN